MKSRSLVSSTWSRSGATILFLAALVLLVWFTMQLPEGTAQQTSDGARSPQHGAAAAVAR